VARGIARRGKAVEVVVQVPCDRGEDFEQVLVRGEGADGIAGAGGRCEQDDEHGGDDRAHGAVA